MSESHSSLDCPKCHRIDMVQKVTAIVQGGTHQINGQVPVSRTYQDNDGVHSSTSYESYSATQQTTLARKLMPPPKPLPRTHPLVVFLFLAEAFLLFWAVCSFTAVVSPESAASRQQSGNLPFGVGLALLPISVFFFYKTTRYHRKANEPIKKQTAADLAQWEYSLSKWQELYYCSRDDCLFFPDEGKAFNVSHLYDAIDWHPSK